MKSTLSEEHPTVQLNEHLGEPSNYNGAICQYYFYVYLYRDPKNETPVYVGKGIGYRAWSHLNNSHNKRLSNLISKRHREGYVIRPSILGFFENATDALEAEEKLIASFGRADLSTGSLFNLSDGGDQGWSSGNLIEFRGTTYGSNEALCRNFGVSSSNYRRRINLGWSMEEALGQVEKVDKVQPKIIEANGRVFKSLEAFAEQVGIGPKTVKHRLDNGFSPEQLLAGDLDIQRRGIEIRVGDKQFLSRTEFAREAGLSIKAVGYWLETGWTPEEILNGEVKNRSAVYTIWNDIAVTQTDFAKICAISHTTLIKYKKQGLTDEEIFQLGQRSFAEKLGGKQITYAAKDYTSISHFNNCVLGMSISTVWKWLVEFGLTPEMCFEIVALAKRYLINHEITLQGALSYASSVVQGKKKKLELDGLLVNKTELRNICKTSSKKIEQKLSQGLSGDEILRWARNHREVSPKRGVSPKINPFEYEGHKFNSFADFDRFLDAPWGTSARYKRLGLTIKETKIVIDNAKRLIATGMSENRAYFVSARRHNENKRGGKVIRPAVAIYIKLRRDGIEPKQACLRAGLEKSNSARLEKTHSELIKNPNLPLRTSD